MLTISETAKEKIIKYILEDQTKDIFISVKNKGCSGIQFNFSYIDKTHNYESFNITDNYKIYFDSSTIMFLIGTYIDLEKTAFEEKFIFKNKAITSVCGCGESYKFDLSR